MQNKDYFEEWWNQIVFDGNTRGYHYVTMSKETVKTIWNAAINAAANHLEEGDYYYGTSLHNAETEILKVKAK